MSAKSTILIVDDEPVMREILEGLLINRDYKLAFASGGHDALAQAKALSPDLILLDVMMPDMDGFEVCRHLRADPVLAEVPVIMITALDDRESRLNGIKFGADDFVTKPFDTVELQTRVQTIVRLNRYRRLLEERSKFRWVVEQAEDGFLLLGEQAEILYANTQARLYLALPSDPDEAITETFLKRVKQQYTCEPQAAWSAWPDKISGQSPLYLVRPESEIADAFWLQVEVMEMASRSDERYLISLRDITESIVARRVMWSFHDQVGHKLKTPLTLLTGSLALLREGSSHHPVEEIDSIVAMAYKNATRLQEEVVRIFEFMQGSDLSKLGPTHCCLAELPELIDKIKSDLDLDSVNVDPSDLRIGDSLYLRISAHALEQILRELFNNAKKFHPDQTPQLEVILSEISQGIRFQICDDGLTLSPDQLAKMWMPYYQAEKYFSGQVPGMGLGLATVASMIWSVGGTCDAHNRSEGPGIVVELVIPVEEDGRGKC